MIKKALQLFRKNNLYTDRDFNTRNVYEIMIASASRANDESFGG